MTETILYQTIVAGMMMVLISFIISFWQRLEKVAGKIFLVGMLMAGFGGSSMAFLKIYKFLF